LFFLRNVPNTKQSRLRAETFEYSTTIRQHFGVQARDLLVYMIRRESTCAECHEELWPGQLITLEPKGALCLSCADLHHLVFLPSGDAVLTRRAAKHSRIHAKVLRWSRTRKRYERQGLLVESEAMRRAEEECLADEELRKRIREREAERRSRLDSQYVAEFAEQIRKLFVNCPREAAEEIAQHACWKYSGRIGRSAAAKGFDSNAILLAVQAHVRHQYTRYDDLLSNGYDRCDAREIVKDEVDQILAKWQRGTP
jgi:hypothetical protein